jgi:two-component system NtrC family sensor kinase
MTIVARAPSLLDVLRQLHQRAAVMTGGQSVLLLEHNPRSGTLQATSGHGLDALPLEPWVATSSEAALMADVMDRSMPTLVTEAELQMPELSARMGTSSVLLAPLVQQADRFGVLAVGFDHPPAADRLGRELAELADAYVAALELFRLRENEARHREIRGLLDRFGSTLSETLDLSAGLETFCEHVNRLFGADRTEVWLHDRRARHLVLRASSDPEHRTDGPRVPADDPLSLAASAMRRGHVEIHPPAPGSSTAIVTVPLRGCRRALGALVFEGVRIETGGELALLDRADELGTQLAGAIENLQLLEDVMRSRRELENAFDAITHLIVVWDRGGQIVHVNRAFAERLGLARDQLVMRPLDEFVGPELRAWLASRAASSERDTDTPVSYEVLDPVLKGPFMVTVTAFRDHRGQRAGSVLIARDLAPQAKLQAEREEMQQRLTQSEKLAALGQFIAGIAHELNNPLQGVLGHLELLRVTHAFPKPLRRDVQTIYREADRAAKIVRNLLAFSGSRKSVRRSVSLNAILQKVVAVRASSLRSSNIELSRQRDPQLPRVMGDPLQLHQVFLNIVTNAEHAILASGRPGRIAITTGVSSSGDRVVVSVRDTGDGIPPDVVSRIFEPFYTTKDVGKGTGLGLAITYGIVQEHGGDIVAANHDGGGAVITVAIPTAASKQAAQPPAVDL